MNNVLLDLFCPYTEKQSFLFWFPSLRKKLKCSFSSPFPLFDSFLFENEETSPVPWLPFRSRPSIKLHHACVISFVDETVVA